MIDRWLLKKYPDFKHWIPKPPVNSLLTAGFPNVIVTVLPQAEVEAAMQTARQNLLQKWSEIGSRVFSRLEYFMPELKEKNNARWNGWLKAQWKTYWAALPVVKKGTDTPLVNRDVFPIDKKIDRKKLESWLNEQNDACNLKDKKKLFLEEMPDLKKF